MRMQDSDFGMATRLSRQAELFVPEISWLENRNFDAQAIASVPLFVGCAGWNLARSVQHNFPSNGTHLERYSRVLPAVEINSSFYRPHRAATYARWRDSVPEAFRFSVKMPRSITHRLRLENTRIELQQFLDAANNLQHKLGCVLVQLPPNLLFVPSIARDFLSELRSSVAADIVCEPRHVSWAGHEANEIFDQFRIAHVAADPPAIPMTAPLSCTDTVYVRLHGAPVIYHSAYSEEYLKQLADELADHIKLSRRVWCILDNTASGAAIPNALFLFSRVNAEIKLAARKQALI